MGVILAKGKLATTHYDSAPRPQRSCFANPTLHANVYYGRSLGRVFKKKSKKNPQIDLIVFENSMIMLFGQENLPIWAKNKMNMPGAGVWQESQILTQMNV